MPTISALENARSGMTFERLRLEAAGLNISGANVPIPAGKSGTSWKVAAFTAGSGATNAAPRMDAMSGAEKSVHQPGHPMADADGMVRYPDIDMVEEMTSMMAASRGYEANIRSFNLVRGMMLNALTIGSK